MVALCGSFYLNNFFGCARLSLLCEGFLQFRQAGPTLLRHAGFSSCGSWALERGFSSCGIWAQLLCGMWNLSRLEIKALSSALAGGFLSTAPPGKSHSFVLNCLSSLLTSLLCISIQTHMPLNHASLTSPCMQDQMVIAFYFACWSPFLFLNLLMLPRVFL